MTLEEVKEKIDPVLKRYNLQYAGIFGSVARGEAKIDSDIDVLVKFKNPPTFAGYLALDNDLRSALNRNVDLITEGAVNKFMRPSIEKDLKMVYGQR